MSRFLIVTLPLAGHAYRAVAVADALSARGHEVAWCGSNAYFGPLIAPEAILFPTGTRLFRDQAGHGIAALKSLWQQYLIPMARFTLPAVDRAIGEYQPDVVLVDQHALAGALAAHRHGRALGHADHRGHGADAPAGGASPRGRVDTCSASITVPGPG